MSLFSTYIGPAIAGGVAVVLFQRLITNRKGSEDSVAAELAKLQGATWTFVAMQYYLGILNRTYLVFVTDTYICGAKVKGVVGAPAVSDIRWKDALFYVSPSLCAQYVAMDVTSRAFLQSSLSNFRIQRAEVVEVTYIDSPKWGMGAVPYSGRIFLLTKSGRKIELILLGSQDGVAIRNRLQAFVLA